MRLSKTFARTARSLSESEVSVNARLLLQAGFIDRVTAGVYSFLPLGLRVLQRIEDIVREEMLSLEATEILLPALHPKQNWVTTGRWEELDVLFQLPGAGGKEYALGPTHEEIVTPLAKQILVSPGDFPKSAFQIQTKFRNELRAKAGLLRGREFRMKDLYSFHLSEDCLDEFYERATGVYTRVFERCGLGAITILTLASGGTFSRYSHEFQTITEYGEDTIFVSKKQNIAVNRELLDDEETMKQFAGEELEEKRAIEVGNIFKLMDKYSAAFDLSVQDSTNQRVPVLMGCYGIGTSRLMGAVVEACHDDMGIVWPREIAPYQFHLIPVGKDRDVFEQSESQYLRLKEAGVQIVFDDRRGLSPGERFKDADLVGLPCRLVLSAKTLADGEVEVKRRSQDVTERVPIDSIVQFCAAQ